MAEIGVLFLSYILGSIPFGFLVAYLVKNIDIRKHGSGNIGATNVLRVVGKQWGILVFLLDFLKGFSAPLMTKLILSRVYPEAELASYIFVLSSMIVVCGHNWTIFLSFKGGKGVATSVGAISGLGMIFPKLWLILLLAVAVWIVLFRIFKYVSLASISAAFSFFIFSVIFSLPGEIKLLSLVILLFILLRHRENIKRLFARKENRF